MKAILAALICTALFQVLDCAAEPGAAPEASPELKTELDRQTQVLDAITKDYEQHVTALKNWYARSLDAVEKDAQKRGNLDEVLAIKKERERGEPDPATAAAPGFPEVLRKLALQYNDAFSQADTQEKKAQVAAQRSYDERLDALQKRLTQQGQIDAALAVKEERGKLASPSPKAPPIVERTPPVRVSATPPQAQPPASSVIDKRFYEALAQGAASTDLEKAKKSGGFAEVWPQGGLLAGFEVWEGNWAGHRIIRGLRPIFQTAGGRVRGAGHGHTPGKPPKIVEAKEGYAVAELEVKGGDRLDGFQLVFWKIQPSTVRLDAEGTYKSEWIGGHGGGKASNALNADGRAVLGIYGASGADMNRLGLIYFPK